MPNTIRIGTRKSKLALWQADHVKDLLQAAYPDAQIERVTFVTKGDQVLDKSLPEIGGKGLFTLELETALLQGEIDCAVHSLKDLPTENPAGLAIGAVPPRAAVHDVLISRHGATLDELPQGATIGTSSLRRAAQLRHYRQDFAILDIRGNVPTRITKALDLDGPYDAIVLARAGVERLDMHEHITQILPLDIMLPAPGQGAIGIQCRADSDIFAPLTDHNTLLSVCAERAFLNALEGGCSVPVAAHAHITDDMLSFTGRVIAVDGATLIAASASSQALTPQQADAIGRKAAQQAIADGARAILAEVRA